MSVVDVIGTPVAQVLKGIHNGLSSFLVPSSGPAWGLSIVLLTVCVRLVLFPLFVKQIKSQRRMAELAPRIKELQKQHKGDRETLNQEMMKLYKDNNANPIAGCLPLVLQLPVFFALFSVIREFKPGASPRYGLSASDLAEGGRARIFGAPLSAAFNSSADFVQGLGGRVGTVKVVAVVMLVLMGASTFWTQRQMMARNTVTDPTQQSVQKVLLYVLPLSFAVFGFSFPIGVLLYWLTTNVWSMGQQAYVIKRMPPPTLGTAGTAGSRRLGGGSAGSSVSLAKGGSHRVKGPADQGGTDKGTTTRDTGIRDRARPTAQTPPTVDAPLVPAGGGRPSSGPGQGSAGGSGRSTGGGPAGRRPQGSRSRKKGRRGGRH